MNLIKVPVTQDLYDATVAVTGIMPFPHGGHLGDPDFSQGYLYAPVEKPDHVSTADPQVVVWDSNLVVKAALALATGPVPRPSNSSPWVAINPIDGLLYTSMFVVDGGGYALRSYHILRDASGVPNGLSFDHYVLLTADGVHPTHFERVQGGAFSPMGHLYIVDDEDGRGVYGYELPPMAYPGQPTVVATQRAHLPISYGGQEELEGMDIWDRSSGPASPGIGGQLHVMMGHGIRSVMWFKHFDVRSADHGARFRL